MDFATSSMQLSSLKEAETDLGNKNQYNHEEASRILDIVNKLSPHQLKNYNISQMRLSKLLHRRDIQGNFKAVNDLLELEGFGVKILERFCRSILQDQDVHVKDPENQAEQEDSNNIKKGYQKKNSFVTPALLEASYIKTVVSFHMDLNFFAWSKICYNPEATDTGNDKYYLEEWHCYEMGDSVRKPKLPDLLKLLVHLNKHIPHADVYVCEALPLIQTMRNNQSQIVVNITKAQFHAMVSTVMALRKPLIMPEPVDNVFYLKSFLSSRYYKYLIGNERIASENVIESLFEYNAQVSPLIENPKLASIDIPLAFKEYWNCSSPVHKEYLGNSLLVGLTFMKLCVEKCKKSIELMKVHSLRSKKEIN